MCPGWYLHTREELLSLLHGGTEGMEDAEREVREGQAPGSVVSHRGDFISFFVNSLSNFTCVLYSAAEQ